MFKSQNKNQGKSQTNGKNYRAILADSSETTADTKRSEQIMNHTFFSKQNSRSEETKKKSDIQSINKWFEINIEF